MSKGGAHPPLHEEARKLGRGLVKDVGMAGVPRPTVAISLQSYKETKMNASGAIEQYKSYLADVGNIGVRHENTRRFYLSVISALFVFLSMTGDKEAIFALRSEVQNIVGGIGIALCIVWVMHMQSFGAIYKAKFDTLRELEKRMELFNLFDYEWKCLASDHRYRFLTFIDSVAPFLFTVPFVLLLAFKC